MTFRVYDVIEESLEQTFNFSLDRVNVVLGFYPYLYMKREPSGNYIFELFRGGQKVFEKSFTSADIKSAIDSPDDNAYLFFPINPDPYLLLGKGSYRAVIRNVSGSFNERSHIGWIRLHRYPVNDYSFIPGSDGELPFAMKIKVLES